MSRRYLTGLLCGSGSTISAGADTVATRLSDQPVAREQRVAREKVSSCSRRHLKRENFFHLLLRQCQDKRSQQFWKKIEMFISEGIHYVTNSFCKTLLKKWDPSVWCELHSLSAFLLLVVYLHCTGRDGSVGIATCYGLGDTGIESRWGGGRYSAPVHTGTGVHPASYRMGTGSLSRG
jgi:hypothetical protein